MKPIYLLPVLCLIPCLPTTKDVQAQGQQSCGRTQPISLPTSDSWKVPYEVLPVPSDVGSLSARLQAETSVVWLAGDVLTFLHKSSAE